MSENSGVTVCNWHGDLISVADLVCIFIIINNRQRLIWVGCWNCYIKKLKNIQLKYKLKLNSLYGKFASGKLVLLFEE